MKLESQLAAAESSQVRAQILRDSVAEFTAGLVYTLCEEARHCLWTDLAAATWRAEAAYSIARRIHDAPALAEALRLKGHVLYSTGDYIRAERAYRRALAILEKLGAYVDVGRTLSSALQTLIYLGRYEEALQWAARAKEIFEREHDSLRLARLDNNIGNILYRQDRYDEALELYQRAISGLRECGDYESVAISQRSMAVCYTAVHDFDRALEAYEQARQYGEQNDLKQLTAEVNDNIANLYYLRGDYTRAIALYQSSDVVDRGNTYHVGVARLDQSDLYLELNLFTEAARCAGDAVNLFQQLGMRYEQAKAFLNLALSTRITDPDKSLSTLTSARRLFQREKNSGWAATADLYRALLLMELARFERARHAALAALHVLDRSSLFGKKILCSLLLVQVELVSGNVEEAHRYIMQAESYLQWHRTAPLSLLVYAASGQVAEAQGNPRRAWQEYIQAHRLLEILRGQLPHELIKIAFLKDKQAVYANLVRLAVCGSVAAPIEEILQYVEQAKSRSLAESMGLDASVEASTGERFVDSQEMRALRGQLNWYYHQLDRLEASRNAPADSRTDALRDRIAQCEERLISATALQEAAHDQALRENVTASLLERIQRTLDDDQALLEYFVTGGRLHLFVITSSNVHSVPLGRFDIIQKTCRLLVFQMSKGVSDATRTPENDISWLTATQRHLRQLYKDLIEPAEPWLPRGHWVVVPHGPLHRLPFHAFYDSGSYLIDHRTLSYAPSALVYLLCTERRATWAQDSAVFGVGDDRAPGISQEAESIANLLPEARLLLGSEATIARLRDCAGHSRFIHLAAHGLFRQDNPLFSSIRMGDSRLCLYDLYDLKFAAELVTLSGCATGVHESVGADEVIGFARGLLHGGAHTVHLSLWEVNDRSTLEYMLSFYSTLKDRQDISEAQQAAMLDTRSRYPHPYYWAPFAVTGRGKRTLSSLFPADSGDSIEMERT